MQLLNDEVLGRSSVVANCRMNRERRLTGRNGYERDLRFNPFDFLEEVLQRQERAAWLDLCCGEALALVEAAGLADAGGLADRLDIVGVDLVGRPAPGPSCLRLVQANLSSWEPGRSFDLITCVHGLHYVGDKLGLIARACGWLTEAGLFAGNLDLANLRDGAGRPAGRSVVLSLRGAGLEYDGRHRLLSCRGRRDVRLPWHYLGADDRAGPNYTGQPAVHSGYEHAG